MLKGTLFQLHTPKVNAGSLEVVTGLSHPGMTKMTLESLKDLTLSICDPLVCPISLSLQYLFLDNRLHQDRRDFFRQLHGQRKLLES